MTRDSRRHNTDFPQQFGQYTLLDRLAVGGMAEIYLAKTTSIGGFEKTLVVKKLRDNLSQDDDFIEMMVDEAKIAVRLKHANVAKIFDLGRIDSQYYIAMEYIEGADLSWLLQASSGQGERLPIPAVLFIGVECCRGLHYAHTRHDDEGRPMRIVHRDVSPANIMLSVEGEVKIVDFGIAKARQRAQETRHGIIKGKFKYMAPEQAEGERVDGRTDVFSVGMVLYEMLTGENPYEGYGEQKLVEHVRRADIPPVRHHRSTIDAELDRIVMRAISKAPGERYPSAAEFERSLTDYHQRKCAPYEGRQLAQLVRRFWNRRGDGPGEATSPTRRRSEAGRAQLKSPKYEAAESSTTYGTDGPKEGPTSPDNDEENSFADGAPTRVWRGDGGGSDKETSGVRSPAAADGANSLDSGGARQTGRSSREENHVDGRSLPPQPKTDEIVSPGGPPTDQARDSTRQTPPNSEPTQKTCGAASWMFEDLVDRLEEAGANRGVQMYAAVVFTAVLLAGAVSATVSVWTAGGGETVAESIDKEPVQSAASDRQPATVDVPVRTTPDEVEVQLDGDPQGTTPLELEELEVGRAYELTFEKARHTTDERTLTPSSAPEPVSVSLFEADGIVQVTTDPSGATVTIDGEEFGDAPVTVEKFSRDRKHEVVAQLDETEQVRTVSWNEDDDDLKEVAIEFEKQELEEPRRRPRREKQAARNRREASNTGSSGRESGEATEPSDEPDETSKESASASAGGEDEPTNLDIWGTGESEETGAEGQLSIQVKGGWGKVYVDDELVASETPMIEHELEPGTYAIKVYYPVLKRFSEVKTVEIESGETTRSIFEP